MRSLFRRLGALLLLALALLPFHRLLDPARTGLAGQVTRRVAEGSWGLGLWGTLVTVGVACVLGLLVRWDPVPAAHRLGTALIRPGPGAFAALCGLLAAALSAAVALGAFAGLPTSVDEMVQLAHARALLAGSPALPVPGDPAAWMVQNALLVPGGLASVYPPVHTALLAAGLAVGAPWLVGPVATGALAAASAWCFETLLPERRKAARTAGVLVAVAPFIVFLGGTELSHPTAAAFVALTLLGALRARDGSWAWSIFAGAALGAAVCDRPWTGLALGGAVVAATWLGRDRAGPSDARGRGWLGTRALGLVMGGIPFAAFLFAWNSRLYGGPLRLGYLAAFGPAHGLGLHMDPWSNGYGAREALAYTGADVSQLGARLFESPLSAVAWIGVALLVAAPPAGSGVLWAWAAAGVVSNALYWHHGIHFGPRLWMESAPAWIALWVLATATLTGPRAPLGAAGRRAAGWAAGLTLVGGALMLPGTLAAYRTDAASVAASRLPVPPSTPALFFAHGSWSSRVAARLVATGMRRDSVETALRRNDLCALDGYARWRRHGRGSPPDLDLRFMPGSPSGLRQETISPGNRILVDPGGIPTPACTREARADREGTVELEPLLWQGAPVSGASVVVARDLGPEANEAVRAAFPDARAWVLVAGPDGSLEPEPYEAAMRRLWGAPAAGGSETRR